MQASTSCLHSKTSSTSSFRSGCFERARSSRFLPSGLRSANSPIRRFHRDWQMTATEHAIELTRRAERIAVDVAGPAAPDVDRDARFPIEAYDALREASLLSVLIPREFGGEGATVAQVADIAFELGRHCASTGLIYAMHQSQVASLVRHGRSDAIREYLAEM